MNFNPSLNYGTLRAQDLQKLKGKEKEPEQTEQGEQSTGQTVATPKPVQVEASALEVLAGQNIAFQQLKTDNPQEPKGVDGQNGKGHIEGYDELVSEWNENYKTMSPSEKVDLLTQILSKVGDDKVAECKWSTLRMTAYIQMQEEPWAGLLSDLQNGTITGDEVNWNNLSEYLPEGAPCMFPAIFVPNEYASYYGGMPSSIVELYGPDRSAWPKSIQIENLRAYLAELNLFLIQFEIKSYNPNLSNEELARLFESINRYTQWKQDIEQQIRDLQGVILKETNEVTQNSSIQNEL